MKTYSAGQPAGSGLYISFSDWDLQVVSGENEALEGPPQAQYRRIPLLALVVLSPVIGGLYAMAFPLVIFGAFLRALRDQVSQFRLYGARELVGWGVYVGINRLCVSYVSANYELLDGPDETRFIRIPTWMVIVGSPFIGGLYVVLFPFLLAGALLTVLLGLALGHFSDATNRLAPLTVSRWAPTAAYLDKPEAKDEDEPEPEPAPEDPLADLAGEIAARRAQETAPKQDSNDDDRSAS